MSLRDPSRLAPLSANEILADTPSEPVFDRFTQLLTEIFSVPVALISVVDDHRQYFKSMTGLTGLFAEKRETPLSHSFCQHVVAYGEPLIIADAREDDRVRSNLAVRDLGVIAYAGAPIFDDEGNAFAALCAIDSKPRPWTKSEISILRSMAEQITNEVTMRQKLSRMGVDLQNLIASEETRRQMAQASRHDLRTPLHALLLNLVAVREFGPLCEDQQTAVDAAERCARELLEMVDQLLDIDRVDRQGRLALQLSAVPIQPLLDQAREQIAPLASQKKLAVSVRTSAPDLALRGDRDKLLRVLVNLLGNAVKFTPAGKIELTAAAAAGDSIVLAVQDTGIGIAEEHLPRIFDEDFRVDPTVATRRSTGLGLTFCKRIVEAHGGEISVTSTLGGGSCFSIALPRNPAA